MKLVILITKGIVRDQHTRRLVMFIVVLVALLMLFAGATFLYAWLRSMPVWFIIYWAICGWFTMLSVLMAIFDLLVVRAQARRSRRELHREIFGHPPEDERP
ncbi:MAG: hypothetical protein QM796_10010 [Chthoniobacteraceae bacterium]